MSVLGLRGRAAYVHRLMLAAGYPSSEDTLRDAIALALQDTEPRIWVSDGASLTEVPNVKVAQRRAG